MARITRRPPRRAERWRRPDHRRPGRFRRYLRTDLGLTWRYGYNLGPTVAYRRAHSALQGEARRVAEDLDRDGVAVTSAGALFGDDPCFGDLLAGAGELEAQQAAELRLRRAAAAQGAGSGSKPYQLALLGERPELDPASVFARTALANEVRGVANAYFGMATRVREYNVIRTFATSRPPRESQLWHRDIQNDRFVVKVFVYLEDVDVSAGPFTYAPGTHGKGTRRLHPEGVVDGRVVRSTDEQMAEQLPPGGWLEVPGPRGTIVFADTTGYHRGGWARERERLVYTCTFNSRTAPRWRKLRVPDGLTVADEDVAFAFDLPCRAFLDH